MRELDVWRALAAALAVPEPVWLCTVLSTWGSSPRPAGSLMVCDARGLCTGSLSGGCVEEALVARLLAGDFPAPVQRVRYGEDPVEAERLRLPCGGILEVMVECVSPQPPTCAALQDALAALAQRECGLVYHGRTDGLFLFQPSPESGQPVIRVLPEPGEGIVQAVGPACRLLLLGVSEVSRAVAQFALLLDYEILVCDPRPEARARWDIAGVTLLADLPDDAVRQYAQDPQCAILALTHDPRIDDMGLMAAFATEAFYIGAMGSQQTSARRRERLLALDVSPASLARLHAPIGLATGSKTPAEIAVSILAELTAVRAGKAIPRG